MSDIKAFMTASVGKEEKSVVVSNRFKDENGKPVPFVIKVLTQEENESLRRQASKPQKRNGVIIGEQLDSVKYGKLLVLASVKEPNLGDKELCKFYGTLDPLDVASRMLTAGEYGRLVQAITDLNGFTEEEAEVLEDEAKNS